MRWYLGCVDGGGGNAVFKDAREAKKRGSDGGVGGMYVQTVSEEGVEAAAPLEGEGVLDGGVDSAGWNTGAVVSVRQRVSWKEKCAFIPSAGDTERTHLVL